jgi:hypothetical protein
LLKSVSHFSSQNLFITFIVFLNSKTSFELSLHSNLFNAAFLIIKLSEKSDELSISCSKASIQLLISFSNSPKLNPETETIYAILSFIVFLLFNQIICSGFNKVSNCLLIRILDLIFPSPHSRSEISLSELSETAELFVDSLF